MMKYGYSILLIYFLGVFTVYTQEPLEKDTVVKPAPPAFEGSYLIENATNVVFPRNTLEFQIKHRFGLVNAGQEDLAGIWAPSNIMLGISYAISDRWTLGFTTVKFDRLQNFNLKVALMRQSRSGKNPFNITYFGNFTIDARNRKNFELDQDRFSFFNQVLISRRFSPRFSMLIAPSLSHHNLVNKDRSNDIFGLAFGGRLRISPQTSLLLDYSHPFVPGTTTPEIRPGLAVGIEISTMGHAFQIFITNYNALVPQKNYAFNSNDFFAGDFLIGFNITRAYRF